MSIIDKIAIAIMPRETEEKRASARFIARALADPGDWLWYILDHHEGIETAFSAVRQAETRSTRAQALRQLGVLLTGHAQAEETVIYPTLVENAEKGHAAIGYEEQAMIKIQMAMLEKLDPMSQEFDDKLGHMKGRCNITSMPRSIAGSSI